MRHKISKGHLPGTTATRCHFASPKTAMAFKREGFGDMPCMASQVVQFAFNRKGGFATLPRKTGRPLQRACGGCICSVKQAITFLDAAAMLFGTQMSRNANQPVFALCVASSPRLRLQFALPRGRFYYLPSKADCRLFTARAANLLLLW